MGAPRVVPGLVSALQLRRIPGPSAPRWPRWLSGTLPAIADAALPYGAAGGGVPPPRGVGNEHRDPRRPQLVPDAQGEPDVPGLAAPHPPRRLPRAMWPGRGLR